MAAEHSDPKSFADWYEQDYFRRPRAIRRARVMTALAAAAVSLAAVGAVVFGTNHAAFQAGPLAPPHATLEQNCAACHTMTFATAQRFIPGTATVRATPDEACLACHPAGAHSAVQTSHTGLNGLAADCASCHREHHGIVPLTRIPDAHCTECHSHLETSNGSHRFAANIHSLGDHPPFGSWRGAAGVTDPGTLKFNHKVHLDLASKLSGVAAERLGTMAVHLRRLAEQSCTSCHQSDSEGRYMMPVRYEAHCAGCHPLTAQLAGNWPDAAKDAWARTPLPHPGRGESAAMVRGAILERYFSLLGGAAATSSTPDRPAVLMRARELTGQAESRLFAPDGGDVIAELERPHFQLRGGCAYCHSESASRPPGAVPEYAPPRLRDRWASLPVERFGDPGRRSDGDQRRRDRWFPYARFNHDRHRDLACTECHRATASTSTADVLMPTIQDCRQCHTQKAGAARADCIECHTYHDHSRERPGLRGRRTIDDALRRQPSREP